MSVSRSENIGLAISKIICVAMSVPRSENIGLAISKIICVAMSVSRFQNIGLAISIHRPYYSCNEILLPDVLTHFQFVKALFLKYNSNGYSGRRFTVGLSTVIEPNAVYFAVSSPHTN